MTFQRSIYLTTIPIPEALAAAKEALDREQLIRREVVLSQDALGRVTAGPIFSRYSSPTFHSAAMDGVAVDAEATFTAREGRPLELKLGRDYRPVNTGHAMPEGTNAVIMIEQVVQVDEETIAIEAPTFPWQHVRRIGEDIVATELLLPQNHRITPFDVGALLSAGIWEIEVWERVRIAFIPTGDEVLDFTTRPEPKPGQVVESNSQVFKALGESWGCVVTRTPPVRDELGALTKVVRKALEDAHIVVIGAGSSAGTKDFTRTVMESQGRILVHGIAAMPGKPSLLGEAGGKLLVGAPGYPVSAVICFEELVRPLAAWMGRRDPGARPKVRVELTRKTPSKLGVQEFMRLAIGRVGEKWVATPLARGAGMITTLTKAQGIARIPMHSEGVEAGALLDAELLVPEAEMERTIVCVGSHDNTLDLLTNELMGLAEPFRLASTHVGSMGGLTALRNGAAHLAGCHLFDPETADYNFPFLAKYLAGLDLLVINLAIRHQGLITAKGNPKSIRGVEDLARPDLTFINRQRGAGTRILLDHHLKQADITSDSVKGYDKEEYTHMAVAVNVLSGAADCGLGIFAAAKALNLDFVPLARERYDLIIPRQFADDPKITTILDLIRSETLQAKIRDLGGYDTDLTGKEMMPEMGLG
ncbi:molybdopterin biosynthesis protein [Desulfonatronum sp. SC1]|uniref:molybdopterin biosynthesis protein n=1 Tax=Desulfonatronum sp. SC1 TaxID=2109626 RepID=UPI000D32052B|nr:molybdopterin biosynthesis protein [Desulfonatronum sp. SC1]PTN37834.1 molybdopterin biosynthesis protein [Desulfonatronum sp. SC1]